MLTLPWWVLIVVALVVIVTAIGAGAFLDLLRIEKRKRALKSSALFPPRSGWCEICRHASGHLRDGLCEKCYEAIYWDDVGVL